MNKLGACILGMLLAFSAVFAQVPSISSFAPTSGAIGSTVTITGASFNAIQTNNAVFFGQTQATVTASSTTSIDVTVPIGATYQPYITVLDLASGLSVTSTKPFKITFTGLVSLNARVNFSTGFNPYFVCSGDFNGDGKPDLAIANYNASSVSILRNTTSVSGTIAFASKVDFTTGSAPASVCVGDLDGDGKSDLAVVNYGSDNVSIFRNTSTSGSVSFATKIDATTGSSPISVCMGDIDGDGKPDLAIANNASNTVSVFRNTSSIGAISFAANVDIGTGSFPASVCMGDLDGDGKSDLAVANNGSDDVSVLRNTSTSGTISFATKVDFASGSFPRSVAISDLDGDGKSDLAVANIGSNTVSLFHNTSSIGTVSFAARVDKTTGTSPISVAIGDLDGDGKSELAVANNGGKSVSLFKNNSSSGTFTIANKVDSATGTSPYSVAISDLDVDGKPDLAVANNASSTVSVLLNNPSPSISSFTPSNGITGTSVTITGKNFTGTTAVTIGGTAVGSFVVNSATSITAVLGVGSTGLISVTTPLGTVSSSGTFTYLEPPVAFNVTGGGSYCSLDSGVVVALDSSEVGVNYQLKNNSSNIGIPISGTGAPLSFGLQTVAGTYTVVAQNAINPSVSTTMNGSAAVIVNQETTSSTTVTACDSYFWNDLAYTTSGVYTYVTSNAVGCDSTATLNLTIKNSSISEITVFACNSYTWFGQTYISSGTYTKTDYVNAVGCDSTLVLNLTINLPSSSNTSVTICGDYTWNGITYTTSGIKSFSALNQYGCDSTAFLDLTINQPSSFDTSVTKCGAYIWYGQSYSSSGVYNRTGLTNSKGCDSTATLHFVNTASTFDTTVIACSYQYVWYGDTLTMSGIYNTTGLTNQLGCDSSSTLNLKIDTYEISVDATADYDAPLCLSSLIDLTATPSFTGSPGISNPTYSYKWTIPTNNLVDSNGMVLDSVLLQSQHLYTSISNDLNGGDQVVARVEMSTDDPCTSTVVDSVVLSIEPRGVWNGNTSQLWSEASNWSCGIIPSSLTDAFVEVGDTIIISDDYEASVKNLIINGLLSFIDTTHTGSLKVYGNWISTGGFEPGNGAVIFADTNQTINSSAKTNGMEYFNHLEIEAGNHVTLSSNSKVDIASNGTLSVNGIFDLNHQQVTLSSDSGQTARLAELPSGAALQNAENFTIERYFTRHRRVRYIASPVVNATIQQLKDSALVSGPAAGGFDAPYNKTTSIKRYNEASTLGVNFAWLSMTNVNNVLGSGQGYYFFGVGNRTTVYPDSTNVTLAFTGVPHTGTINLPVSYSASGTEGWNLVGNPYPSQVSWDAASWTKTNINDAIYIWDPLVGKSGNYYTYVDGVASDGRPNADVIASFQGFFVKANAANPVLQIEESAKTGNIHQANFRKESHADLMRLKLTYGANSDQTVLCFKNGATKNMDDSFDALKLAGGEVSLSTRTGATNYSIQALPASTDTFSVALEVATKYKGTHLISATEFSNELNNELYFIDNYTDKFVKITPEFSYTFDANATNGRFRIANYIPKKVVTGLDFTLLENAILLYPNPTASELTIQSTGTNDLLKTVEVYSIEGTLLLKKENMNRSTYVVHEISGYASGVYLVKVRSEKTQFQKLITKQ